MPEFETGVIVGFLNAVKTAPKGAISLDKVPGNLDPNSFDALSHYCDEMGYVKRTGGVLTRNVVFALITERGRDYIKRHSR